MRLKDLIKRWDFIEDNRGILDLTGGLHLLPPQADTATRLELPRQAAPNGELYSVSLTLTATTWIAAPLSAREWRGFQAEITNATDPDEIGRASCRERV